MRYQETYRYYAGSTNDRMKELARQGAEDWSYCLALSQGGGRGRFGRTWETDDAAGSENVALSLLLTPSVPPEKVSMVTILAAMAAAEAVEAVCGCPCGIKWPNDLILNGRKAAGILTEYDPVTGKVILGIGINVNQKVFSGELREKAASIYQETGKPADCRELALRFTERMQVLYELFCEHQDLGFLKEAYESRLVNRNRRVVVHPEEKTGICRGIDDCGHLLLEGSAGTEAIFAGEVSIRGENGYL